MMTSGLDSEACDRFLSQLHFPIKNEHNAMSIIFLTDGTDTFHPPSHTHKNSDFKHKILTSLFKAYKINIKNCLASPICK